jgi:putative aldouronate transport system substrate-binding protein
MYQPSRRQVLAGAGASAALALVGCGSSGGNSGSGQNLSGNEAGAMKNYGVGDQFKATTPLTFSIMVLSNPAYPYNAKWPFWSDLKQRTNVSFNSTVVPLTDYDTKRGVLINAGNAPMIIPKTYPGEESQYVAGGAILPVSDYVHLMPNFQDKVAKWHLQGDLDTLRQQDGKYYLLPGLHQNVWLDYTLAVRTDILAKLGISTPQTWDDVHTMLKAMKNAHPGSYPLSDRFNQPTPGGSLLNVLSQAYGTAAGWGYQSPSQGAYWDSGTKKFVVTAAMPQFKAMVEYLNTMYNEKLIDPESFTQPDTTAIQNFVTGKSFVMSTNAQTLINDLRSGLKVPGATVAKIPVPIGPLGPVIAENAATRLENGVMISSKARNSKNFVAMMQFIDWLWYSDAGETFARWGIKGLTYDGSISGGTFHLAPDVTWAGINPSGTKNLQVTYGFYNGVFAYGGSTQLLDTQFPPEELQFQKVMDQRSILPLPPPAPLSAAEQQQVTLWGTTLMDYVQQQTLQFILGKRPLSQWDAYVSELQGKNSTQLVNLMNNAYQRYHKKFG